MNRSRFAFTAVILGASLPGLARAQCAMCGTALQGPEDPLSRGMFWSVTFLISLPYAIVGGFIIALAWASYRRSRPSPPTVALQLVRGTSELVTSRKENTP